MASDRIMYRYLVFLIAVFGKHATMGQDVWDVWSDWTECDKTCNKGLSFRIRDCDGTSCTGDGTFGSETRFCNDFGCPVDGGWSEYSDWLPCNVSCEGGYQLRSRTCSDPEAQHGGIDCIGNTEETQTCNTQRCPIDGGWSDWTELTYCNTDCKQFRYRTCDNPTTQHGGEYCEGEDMDVYECSILDCPIDGQWGAWSVHYCDASCNGKKTRRCDKPAPLRGGAWCNGTDREEYGECTVQDCIRDGGWTSWDEWSECSKSCSYGIQSRFRTCTNPMTKNGGNPCPPADTDESERSCYLQTCPQPLNYRKKVIKTQNNIDYGLILTVIFGTLGGITAILLIILGVRRTQLKAMRDKCVEEREKSALYKEAAEMSIIPKGKQTAAAKLRRQKLKAKLKKKTEDIDKKPLVQKSFFDTVFQFEEFDEPRPDRPPSAESRPGTAAFDRPLSRQTSFGKAPAKRIDTPTMMKGLQQIDHQLCEMAGQKTTGTKDTPLITVDYQHVNTSMNPNVNPSDVVAGLASLEAAFSLTSGLTPAGRLSPLKTGTNAKSLHHAMDVNQSHKGLLAPLHATVNLPDAPQSKTGITLDQAMGGGKGAKKAIGKTHLNLPMSREEEVDEIVENFWEVPRDSIEIINTLAMGSFGPVMKAKAWDLLSSQGPSLVVVKELDAHASVIMRAAFIRELDVLKKLDSHPNVISLLGCCTILDPLYMVLEYAPRGELQIFLRRNRPNAEGAKPPMSKNLLNFAVQIAKGMTYLQANKVTHGDLTSRNVLLGDKMVCKVSNVSRVRNVVENVAEGRLGLRWMSLESIYASAHTTQSDVWSYGVLLWEIVNFGATPYPNMSSKEVKSRLQVGYRMGQPPYCSKELYNVMTYCWSEQPDKRPSFKALASMLWKMNSEGVEHIRVKEFDPGQCIDMDDLRPHTPGSIAC